MAKPVVDASGILEPPPGNGKSDVIATLEKALGVEPSPEPVGFLASVQRGRKFEPPRILIYGLDGLGKSTFANQAPKPIFVQTEDGLNEIDCHRLPFCGTYEMVATQLSALAREPHEYETVVIDSLDWLERLIWDHVCRRDGKQNIEKVGGGFAKGYKFALDEWREVIDLLAKCRARGMAVILTAHTKIERFEDPENPAYDRYSPRLHKDAEALIREWVDATLFLTRRLVVKKEGSGFNERGLAAPVGADGGDRILRTVGSPAWVAKNRYSLPAELPFPKANSFGVFVDAMIKGRESA